MNLENISPKHGKKLNDRYNHGPRGFRNTQKYFINQPKKRRPQPAPKAITSINLAVDQDPMDASRYFESRLEKQGKAMLECGC